MFNPLIQDLAKLKDNELEAKIHDLNTKYSIALRLGNSGLLIQINMALDALKYEVSRRHHEAEKKLFDEDKDLGKLIKVG